MWPCVAAHIVLLRMGSLYHLNGQGPDAKRREGERERLPRRQTSHLRARGAWRAPRQARVDGVGLGTARACGCEFLGLPAHP